MDGLDLIPKAQVKHPICLINHQEGDMEEGQRLLFDLVNEATLSGGEIRKNREKNMS